MTFVVGSPMDLSPWAGRPDAEAAREATTVIMASILELVEQARGSRFEALP